MLPHTCLYRAQLLHSAPSLPRYYLPASHLYYVCRVHHYYLRRQFYRDSWLDEIDSDCLALNDLDIITAVYTPAYECIANAQHLENT